MKRGPNAAMRLALWFIERTVKIRLNWSGVHEPVVKEGRFETDFAYSDHNPVKLTFTL